MQTNIKRRFFTVAKSKVVIGFLLACFALLTAWAISRFAFKKMLRTVEEISAPNERLKMVNQLSHSISKLDQLQRDQAINNKGKSAEFIRESRASRGNLDSLAKLYAKDKAQLRRIRSIKRLLDDKDQQFVMYMQVRETLVNTKSFSEEVSKLSDLIAQRGQQRDSALLTTETSTSTTIVAPEEEKKSRGFLSKLFGKKKSEVYKIINEEFKIKRDTLNTQVEDSIANHIDTILRTIETEQKEKSARFLKREADLATASTLITTQMLNILKEVEADAVAQVDLKNNQAKAVVNKGAGQITALLIGFFFLTIVLVYLILTDIASINRYRKDLETAKDEAEYHSKAKQRFLSNMSHEIRTPLQSILGYAELIAQQDKPNQKNVDAIYQSAMHLLQIVNEVLDYNRIISGEFTFSQQVFNVGKVLDEVVEVMRPLAEQKQVGLVAAFDLDGVQYALGDAFRLKQILFNLLGNAIKFTVEGQINFDLSLKRHGDFVHFNFVIKDTGIGFDEAHIQRIFNEFEQLESNEKYIHNQTGTGLGLAIVKSLVESQGGHINVKSQKEKGTTFTFHLKYRHAEKPENELEAIGQNPIVNTGKVWMIDDDQLILELCALIFEKHDIPYQTFNTAQAILNAEHSDVNYVLIDMRLPEMSGLELHRILKHKMPSHVKFYAITAQVLPDEQQAILAEGFNGLITKPFKTEDLLSIFERMMVIEEQVAFDVSTIEKMTLGDQQLLQRILNQFQADCQQDSAMLKESIEKDDKANCRLIVHRLAGRTAQVGAAALAAKFRKLELVIAESPQVDEKIKNQVNSLIEELNQLLVMIDEIDYSMP
ncbi:hybrid sensor histidine kinase/response regulator [Pedobacter sp. ASV12]|uniref:hybrid sensor histidine kinase/response regulator n=1 Tax=Pedobacter sp. ASV12 TaxID=2795120 RepID=UPI0018EB6694|nr:ATP-binding protein [Pedobacter sp. ASV12]